MTNIICSVISISLTCVIALHVIVCNIYLEDFRIKTNCPIHVMSRGRRIHSFLLITARYFLLSKLLLHIHLRSSHNHLVHMSGSNGKYSFTFMKFHYQYRQHFMPFKLFF